MRLHIPYHPAVCIGIGGIIAAVFKPAFAQLCYKPLERGGGKTAFKLKFISVSARFVKPYNLLKQLFYFGKPCRLITVKPVKPLLKLLHCNTCRLKRN